MSTVAPSWNPFPDDISASLGNRKYSDRWFRQLRLEHAADELRTWPLISPAKVVRAAAYTAEDTAIVPCDPPDIPEFIGDINAVNAVVVAINLRQEASNGTAACGIVVLFDNEVCLNLSLNEAYRWMNMHQKRGVVEQAASFYAWVSRPGMVPASSLGWIGLHTVDHSPRGMSGWPASFSELAESMTPGTYLPDCIIDGFSEFIHHAGEVLRPVGQPSFLNFPIAAWGHILASWRSGVSNTPNIQAMNARLLSEGGVRMLSFSRHSVDHYDRLVWDLETKGIVWHCDSLNCRIFGAEEAEIVAALTAAFPMHAAGELGRVSRFASPMQGALSGDCGFASTYSHVSRLDFCIPGLSKIWRARRSLIHRQELARALLIYCCELEKSLDSDHEAGVASEYYDTIVSMPEGFNAMDASNGFRGWNDYTLLRPNAEHPIHRVLEFLRENPTPEYNGDPDEQDWLSETDSDLEALSQEDDSFVDPTFEPHPTDSSDDEPDNHPDMVYWHPEGVPNPLLRGFGRTHVADPPPNSAPPSSFDTLMEDVKTEPAAYEPAAYVFDSQPIASDSDIEMLEVRLPAKPRTRGAQRRRERKQDPAPSTAHVIELDSDIEEIPPPRPAPRRSRTQATVFVHSDSDIEELQPKLEAKIEPRFDHLSLDSDIEEIPPPVPRNRPARRTLAPIDHEFTFKVEAKPQGVGDGLGGDERASVGLAPRSVGVKREASGKGYTIHVSLGCVC
ncbi:hypothetical protein CYLTODRAFT_459901 [Cylindrobasidium torrendii FP15055 ss-10]|uniref:Uncharacterized protein n=1 Tax=Cylindrobasidium torrendii FP15055 ss-10 TaxID=1314674 RepID=A0A0D7AU53_9AGAR|nr:hypothetical protein CYLTODRAFT_459901 [Cylindrobasidium torrendii FP15055 ss-10]